MHVVQWAQVIYPRYIIYHGIHFSASRAVNVHRIEVFIGSRIHVGGSRTVHVPVLYAVNGSIICFRPMKPIYKTKDGRFRDTRFTNYSWRKTTIAGAGEGAVSQERE